MKSWSPRPWCLAMLAVLCAGRMRGGTDSPEIEFWHGDRQEVGHLGVAQPDFNLLGHVRNWDQVEQLRWEVNETQGSPMGFHAFRRLVADGDFNADIPVAWLRTGENIVRIVARLRDSTEITREMIVLRTDGNSRLPYRIEWRNVQTPQEVGQYVDGRWRLTEAGLRTDQIGYDRLFLIGELHWSDYEVRSTVTIHSVRDETSPLSGGAGVGIICRFAGHCVGGIRDFPAAQPKWGYQPFGAIGWVRWEKGVPASARLEYYPGVGDRSTAGAAFPYRHEQPYHMRMRCETLADSPEGGSATQYSFKIWPAGKPEPGTWSWQMLDTGSGALLQGGVAFVAHHVDATFGDIEINPIPASSPAGSTSASSTVTTGH